MKNIYVCYTQYHVLIAIAKCMLSKEHADIVLSTDNENTTLVDNEQFIERLNQIDIFDEIIIYNPSYEQLKLKNGYFYNLKKLVFIRKMQKKCPIDFSKYKNVYFFNDVLLLGRCINYKKISYHLIEDGTDCFINNKKMIVSKFSIRNFIKKYVLGMIDMGESKYVIDIEVNNSKNLFFKNKKIIEMPKKVIFSALSNKDKSRITSLFLGKNDLERYNGYSLILTQPLSEDKVVDSENDKLKLYKMIIEQYCKNDEIVIKTHPREKTNYLDKLHVSCINENFPLEILSFYNNLNYNKIITISSTSIVFIPHYKEKIVLGWEWIDNIKKRSKINDSK